MSLNRGKSLCKGPGAKQNKTTQPSPSPPTPLIIKEEGVPGTERKPVYPMLAELEEKDRIKLKER